MADDQLIMRLHSSVFDDLHAPPQAQECRACGVLVQTYEEWFTTEHDVPGYLRLPWKKESDDNKN
jgi:hypothetical protein